MLADNTITKLDSMVEAHIQKNRISGAAVAVVQGEEIVYARGYGRESILADVVLGNGEMMHSVGLEMFDVLRFGEVVPERDGKLVVWFSETEQEHEFEALAKDLFVSKTEGLIRFAYFGAEKQPTIVFQETWRVPKVQ